jgi:PEP-CTERM motif
MKSRILITSCAALLASLATQVHAQLVLTGDLIFASEGGPIGAGNFGTSGTAFALDLIAGGAFAPTHTIANVNNGTFGNSSSWIGDSPNSYVGLGFGSLQTIASFAFGRDNLGQFGDRAVGLYTVQFTTDANPAVNYASNLWNTVGTIDLRLDTVVGVTNPALRHRFNIGTPVNATGFRLIAPNGAAIDELELFSAAGVVTPPTPPISINSVPGFSVSWDGNDGDNFSANGIVPNNLALAANAAVPFSSGDLGPQIAVPFHRAVNLNDGLYGNANSWIGGDGNPAPFHAGILLEDVHEITSIAWGRDNGLDAANGDCCGGQLSDRSLGTYTIQRTLDGVVWETVGTVAYNYSQDALLGGGFTSHFRHEFELTDGNGGVDAIGMRILVPSTGIGGGTAIDEIELYGTPVPEPGSAALLLGGLGFLAARRRRV